MTKSKHQVWTRPRAEARFLFLSLNCHRRACLTAAYPRGPTGPAPLQLADASAAAPAGIGLGPPPPVSCCLHRRRPCSCAKPPQRPAILDPPWSIRRGWCTRRMLYHAMTTERCSPRLGHDSPRPVNRSAVAPFFIHWIERPPGRPRLPANLASLSLTR